MTPPPERPAKPDWGTIPEPDPAALHFKWGWNHESGEATVWTVAGGADGLPVHNDHLEVEWGRTPRPAEGDVLGIASLQPPSLFIDAYFGDRTPSEVIDWFRSVYPDTELVFSGR